MRVSIEIVIVYQFKILINVVLQRNFLN